MYFPNFEGPEKSRKVLQNLTILKNNKLYGQIVKLLKIFRSSVYYTLKNFGPTSFSSQKNQSGRRHKTTKLNENRIHLGDEREHAKTSSFIYSETSPQ
jgi:hypothetical protein